MCEINFTYRFHPVGQGLFASGTLKHENNSMPNFNWVFDCGSMAKEADWINQVTWYRDLIVQDRKINLLCISHFDKDHVSGLTQLLKDRHVDTVVIPYFTPVERLVIASLVNNGRGPGKEDGGYLDFLSNPAAYIIEQAARVDRILVIARHSPDSTDFSSDFDVNPESPINYLTDRPLNINPDEKTPEQKDKEGEWILKDGEKGYTSNEPEFAQALRSSLNGWRGRLSFLMGESLLFCMNPVLSSAAWEFKFFHKPEDTIVLRCLRKNVDNILDSNICQRAGCHSLVACLQNKVIRNEIKKVYRSSFKGPRKFNAAGLSVYSGPVNDNLLESEMSCSKLWHGIPPVGLPLDCHCSLQYFRRRFNCHHRIPAILYTGDADLSTGVNRNELKGFLGSDRWESITILQVPHHGSEHSWEVGASKEFYNLWSVFSADPSYRYKHPHQPVLLDLLNRNPVLVDKHIGVAWSGVCYFR